MKNNNIKISVIIPAYNVEQYLDQCIDSILHQNIDLEIIVINDGSTDKTGDTAERYLINNKNIKVVHQAHSGPSTARNKGLDITESEYIAFIDSDDWIAKNSLLNLYNAASKNKADMVMGNMVYHYPDGR